MCIRDSPLSEGAPEARKASKSAAEPTGGRVVLVVDDDRHLQDVLTRSLQELGHQAYGASSIAEAQVLGEGLGQLDVLVADIVLGREQDGHALADELRKTHPELHAIFMSGYVSAERGSNVLQKPFPIDLLEGAIQRSDVTP